MPVATVAFADESEAVMSDTLDNVVVTAEKPQIKGAEGTIAVDLPSIVKDKPVTNILEALGYLPGAVSNNGYIGLSGASSVTILINGELTNMPTNNLYQLLYSLPVSKLKNVEIMYSAPAKYHVSGAVINVNLKTPNALDGLLGQAKIGYIDKHYSSWGGALSSMYSIRKWSFDLNYSFSDTEAWNHTGIFSNHALNGRKWPVTEDDRTKGSNFRNSLYASVGYKFSAKSDIKLTYNMQYLSDVKSATTATGTFGNTVNNSVFNEPQAYHNIGIVYRSPFALKVSAGYTSFFEDRTRTLSSSDNGTALSVSDSEQKIDKLYLYLDQSHKVKEWGINYGAGYIYTKDNSVQNYRLPSLEVFDSRLEEHTANAYIGTNRSFKWGLSFNASLKGEYYRIADADNWKFVPQLGVTYYKTPASIFQLNFTSKKIYPSYWEMHNSVNYLNDYTTIKGNPGLRPYTDYSAQFSYIFKQKYVATLYCNYTDDYAVQLPYQSPDELKLIYQTSNFNYNRILGLNIHIPVTVKDIFNSTLSLNGYINTVKADRFHDISFFREKGVFYSSLKNTLKFSKNSPVSLSVDASYISSSLQGIADMSELWRVDAGIKWTFCKKNAELVLRADDIFNNWSPTMRIDRGNQDFRMKVYDMSRSFSVTFTYRFNGFKPKENSGIDTSRFGTDSKH